MDRRDFLLRSGAVVGGLTVPGLASQAAHAAPENQAGTEEVKAGGAQLIPVRGGKYKVWVQRMGNSPIKVLLLHGGPGMSHVYLRCFQDFLPQAGIEMYYYDQLGCLFSDNPDDTSLWTIDAYRDEVEDVRHALGLENFYLFGHSWGGILTYEYALKYPEHLKGIAISNMAPSFPNYAKYVNKLRDELPPDVVKAMKKYEAKGDFDAPEYQQLVEQFFAQHICRLDSWPAPIPTTLKFINSKIYNLMQGPNEFTVTGTLKNWDVTSELHRIKTRALLIGAHYDEMDPDEMRRTATLMPNARAVISSRGSHLCMYDDQQWYFRNLIRFLQQQA